MQAEEERAKQETERKKREAEEAARKKVGQGIHKLQAMPPLSERLWSVTAFQGLTTHAGSRNEVI